MMAGTSTNEAAVPRKPTTSSDEHTGLGRRQFLAGAAGVGLGVAGSGLISPAASAEPAPPFGGYPQFNWSTVPTGADVGNMFRTWTADEARFMADHLSLISIEKGHGAQSDPNGWTEPGFLEDAQELKSFNQPTKVLFYWNSAWYGAFYKASSQVKEEWLRARPNGRLYFDLGNVNCRRWWVETATRMVADRNVDGVFVDAISLFVRLFNPPGTAELVLEELRTSLDSLPGVRPIIMYNGLSVLQENLDRDDRGAADPLLDIADGAMLEAYDPPGHIVGRTPEERRRAVLDTRTAGKKGKIVIFKGWPSSFSFLTDFGRNGPYEEKVSRARAEITFPLASFLVAAERYSYLQYSWGYNRHGAQPDNGVILYSDKEAARVDPTWYPELLRPLGAPLGDAEVDGYVFTRSFAHADVWVNVDTRQAEIYWK